MNKQQFSDYLDALLAIAYTYDPNFMSNEEKASLIDSDGKLVIRLDRCLAYAVFTAVHWSKQNIEDFEPKPNCVMCETPVATAQDGLCDYHLRLKTSGLACVSGYEDEGREVYCAERVYKDNLCGHHYARKQQETQGALYEESDSSNQL